MIRTLTDIECFEDKVGKLFKEAQLSRSGLFNIKNTGEKIGLKKDEIEAMYYHLKRSSMIEDVNGPILKITKYGHMINNGDINHGYVPI